MTPTDAPEHRLRTQASAVEHWRHIAEIVALIVAAAWALYVFVYQEQIKPSFERPNLDLSVSVQQTPVGSGKQLIAIATSWKNRGSVPAQVDGMILNVYGVAYSGRDIAPWHRDTFTKNVEQTSLHEYSRGMRGINTSIFSMYEPWRPLGGVVENSIEPGDTFTLTESLVIPRGRFNAIRATYSWCDRRSDDRRTIIFQPRRLADGTYDVQTLLDEEGARSGFVVNCDRLVRGVERAI